MRGPLSPARRRAGVSVENTWAFCINDNYIPGLAIDGTERGLFRRYSGKLAFRLDLRRLVAGATGSLSYPAPRLHPISTIIGLSSTLAKSMRGTTTKAAQGLIGLKGRSDYFDKAPRNSALREASSVYFIGGLVRWLVTRGTLNPKIRRLRRAHRRRTRRRKKRTFVGKSRRIARARPI